MATYRELKAQAEKLLAQAEELRQQELSTAIDDIKARMTEYGITLRDLGGRAAAAAGGRALGAGAGAGANGRRRPAAVKYRDKAGNTWTGRGRTPRWLQAQLDAGKTAEDFQV